MLCPEVLNFPPPKVITSSKECKSLDTAIESLRLNYYYKSVIITCPDELKIPEPIEIKILEDNDYYRVVNCSVTEFIEPTFIESFVKNGKLHCITANRNCIIDNCAAIIPEGVLTLHVLEYVYQTLGLEGTKRKQGFYEVNIDLKNLRHIDKMKYCLSKLEKFDINIIWEPNDDSVCPSSIAKYFSDKGLVVALCSLEVRSVNPSIEEIPSLQDVDIEELTEWVGMLSHNISVQPKETYISTYAQPDSSNALSSSRISILIIKGLLSPTVIEDLFKSLSEYVSTREFEHYWASISVQSYGDCPWRWDKSSPRMFLSHDCSSNIFITNSGCKIFSIGQLKYS